jgi:hypothetical protein
MPLIDPGRPGAVAAQGGAFPPPPTERRPVPGRAAPTASTTAAPSNNPPPFRAQLTTACRPITPVIQTRPMRTAS